MRIFKAVLPVIVMALVGCGDIKYRHTVPDSAFHFCYSGHTYVQFGAGSAKSIVTKLDDYGIPVKCSESDFKTISVKRL